MLLPIYNDEGPTTFSMFSVKVAMDIYDQLANVKRTSFENYTLTPEESLGKRTLHQEKKVFKAQGLSGFSQ